MNIRFKESFQQLYLHFNRSETDVNGH